MYAYNYYYMLDNQIYVSSPLSLIFVRLSRLCAKYWHNIIVHIWDDINTLCWSIHTHTHTQYIHSYTCVCLSSESQTCVRLAPPPDEMYFNVEPHCRTTIPGSRYGHTVCSYKDRVYMYGGRNDEDGSFSKVDCYDISKSKISGMVLETVEVGL